jgi:hypothetical protein
VQESTVRHPRGPVTPPLDERQSVERVRFRPHFVIMSELEHATEANAGRWLWSARLLALLALVFVSWYALRYAGQPIIDRHGFRQTQTALTSLWMQREGVSLAYETPVAGYPWAIPLEFPIYQVMAAALSSLTSMSLEPAGRVVSWLFLLACAWPAFALNRRLRIGDAFPWVFCALLWTSPLYVFWGRAFMIETAALFFTFSCLPFALDVWRGENGWTSRLAYVALASAGMLQKSTTAAPVLLVLLLGVVGAALVSNRSVRSLASVAVIFGLPLGIGVLWNTWSDAVRAHNDFGAQLAFSAMPQWYLGTLAQRLSLETYRVIVLERSIIPNAGGKLGIFLILLACCGFRGSRRLAAITIAALALFAMPVLAFTNLHFVHDYYQTGNVLFLVIALSVAVSATMPRLTANAIIIPILTVSLMGMNVQAFRSSYGPIIKSRTSDLDPRSLRAYEAGRFVRERTPEGTAIAVFGHEWNSEVAFYAQRKSVTLPSWYRRYGELTEHPERFVGGMSLSAIVVCKSNDKPSADEVWTRLGAAPGWERHNVGDCDVMVASGKP